MPAPTPVLTIRSKTTGKPVAQVYMLNPGQVFPGFGGSRSGLVVCKTASMVVRNLHGGGTTDVEADIYSPTNWAWLARLINEGHALGIEAEGPPGATG